MGGHGSADGGSPGTYLPLRVRIQAHEPARPHQSPITNNDRFTAQQPAARPHAGAHPHRTGRAPWLGGLALRIPVRCFEFEPSIKSSLKFLRSTPGRAKGGGSLPARPQASWSLSWRHRRPGHGLRWWGRTGRLDGGRGAGERRCAGRALRCHAFAGAQVPDGRQGWPQHHAFRTLRGVLQPLRRTAGADRGHAGRLRRQRAACLGGGTGRGDLRRQLGAGVSHREEGGSPAAGLAASFARNRCEHACAPSLAGLRRAAVFASLCNTGRRIDREFDAVVLAMGGGSWARLGSDGAWLPLLAARGVAVAPLRPANCGFDLPWSAHFRERFAGLPVKPVVLSLTDRRGCLHRRQGEFVVTEDGVEGSLIYAFSALLRDAILAEGSVTVSLDLAPGAIIDECSPSSRSHAARVRSRATCRARSPSPGSRPGCCANACRWRISSSPPASPRQSRPCRSGWSPAARSTKRSVPRVGCVSRGWMAGR